MQLFSTPAQAACLGWLIPALGALALTPSAYAQVTQYSSRTNFNAATTGLTTFTFDGYAPQGGSTYYGSKLTVPSGVTFTDDNRQLYVNDAGDGSGDPFNGHQYLNPNSGYFSVILPAGTTAFGADFANFHSISTSTNTVGINGDSFTFDATFQAPGSYTNTSAFVGFTSSSPITSVNFLRGDFGAAGLALTNFSFGADVPAAVPEASTLVSLGIGVLGMGGLLLGARRKRTV